MALFIDSSYFFGMLQVPNLGDTSNAANFAAILSKYEKDFLKRFFGYEFAQVLISEYALPIPTARAVGIIEGGTFIDSKGVTRTWQGLKNDDKESPLANYVYSFWQKINVTKTMQAGEILQTNSMGIKGDQIARVVSPSVKVASAYNDMVRMNKELERYLYYKKEIYPELNSHTIPSSLLTTINVFDI